MSGIDFKQTCSAATGAPTVVACSGLNGLVMKEAAQVSVRPYPYMFNQETDVMVHNFIPGCATFHYRNYILTQLLMLHSTWELSQKALLRHKVKMSMDEEPQQIQHQAGA